MRLQRFKTSNGEIHVWAEAEAFGGVRPAIFVIHGAFAKQENNLLHLPSRIPEADVFFSHLPGNHTPPPNIHAISKYAESYTSVLGHIARPVVVVGSSIGALVAMALTASNLKGTVLLDPPIRTGKLWPLVEGFRQFLRESPDDAGLAEFLWNVFGISLDSHEDRNYLHLIHCIRTPSWAIFGDEPLFPVRSVETLPSLIDEPERDFVRSHPLVRTGLMQNCGHNIAGRIVGLEDVVRLTRGLIAGEDS